MGKNRLGTQTAYQDYYQKGGGAIEVFRGRRRGGGFFSSLRKKFTFKNLKKLGKTLAPYALKAGTHLLAKGLKQDSDVVGQKIGKVISLADQFTDGKVGKVMYNKQKGKGYKRSSYAPAKTRRKKKRVQSLFD